MNKLLYFLLFSIYFAFLNYFIEMCTFDFRKYVLKDKYLQDMHFSYNWVEKYAEKKAYEKFEKEQLLKSSNNLDNIDK